MTNSTFRPYPGLAGGHRQTLAGYWARRFLRFPLPVEDLLIDAAPDVRLLCRATWQPGPRAERPALVLVHGLSGADSSGYLLSISRAAFARGWHVVRLNMRGAGDGEALCPLLYNAGLDSDVLAVLREAARRAPRVALAGFSLGANLALLAASRGAAQLPDGCVGVAAVSAPLDLAACTAAIARRENRLYERNFVAELCAAYRRRQARAPHLYAAGRERGVRSIRDYDERITAPYGGYRDAADYYAQSSAGPYLPRLRVPALLLNGLDDPMIPGESVRRFLPAAPADGLLRAELLPTGGHVGFVGPATAPGAFWAADRVLDFLDERLAAH